MYYFYVIKSLGGRLGFGITSNPTERNKQYTSHSGDIVKFTHLYGGLKTHASALERIIKTQWIDNLWKIEGWKTEWLNRDINIDEFIEHVDSLITQRHLKIELIATDFDFTNPLNIDAA